MDSKICFYTVPIPPFPPPSFFLCFPSPWPLDLSALVPGFCSLSIGVSHFHFSPCELEGIGTTNERFFSLRSTTVMLPIPFHSSFCECPPFLSFLGPLGPDLGRSSGMVLVRLLCRKFFLFHVPHMVNFDFHLPTCFISFTVMSMRTPPYF